MLVQDGRVGAPLARTACHVMRDEPFSFFWFCVLWHGRRGVVDGAVKMDDAVWRQVRCVGLVVGYGFVASEL